MIITIVREAVEEIRCYLRDKEVNSQIYSKLCTRGAPLGLECRAVVWLAAFVSENSLVVVNVRVQALGMRTSVTEADAINHEKRYEMIHPCCDAV